MCNCRNTNGFFDKLGEAKRLTAETGQPHVVYVRKALDAVFVRKLADLPSDICCYYTADGKEVEVPAAPIATAKPAKAAKPAKKKQTPDNEVDNPPAGDITPAEAN